MLDIGGSNILKGGCSRRGGKVDNLIFAEMAMTRMGGHGGWSETGRIEKERVKS